jgi:hypothetical protein
LIFTKIENRRAEQALPVGGEKMRGKDVRG